MQTYRIDGLMFKAEGCEKGILIEPTLPKSFHCFANDARPASHSKWWHRPYITLGHGNGYSVECLDGGAWDRPTLKGSYELLDDAVKAALALCKAPPTVQDSKPLTAAERQARYKANLRAAGLKERMVWIDPDHWAAGFAAGEKGRPGTPVPNGMNAMSYLSGWIEGDAKRQGFEYSKGAK